VLLRFPLDYFRLFGTITGRYQSMFLTAWLAGHCFLVLAHFDSTVWACLHTSPNVKQREAEH